MKPGLNRRIRHESVPAAHDHPLQRADDQHPMRTETSVTGSPWPVAAGLNQLLELNVMKANRSLPSALAVACLLGLSASAQAQGLTRDAVRSELARSLRSADIIVGGEAGLTERQLRLQRGQSRSEMAGKTREQVKSEILEAMQSGSILSHGALMLPVSELAPHRYPARTLVLVKSRQQVKEELDQAQRLGDAPDGSEDGLTPAQRMPAKFTAARRAHALASENVSKAPPTPNAGTTTLR